MQVVMDAALDCSTCPNMFANQKECGGGYGNYITIKHATGVYSRYAHLNSVDVKKGQKVSAGQKSEQLGHQVE